LLTPKVFAAIAFPRSHLVEARKRRFISRLLAQMFALHAAVVLTLPLRPDPSSSFLPAAI